MILDFKDNRTEKEKDQEFVNFFTNDPNNFSYWYPRVKKSFDFNKGLNTLHMPRSIIINIPVDIMKMLFEPGKHLHEIQKFVCDEIMPKIPDDMFFIFMKNGTFSNKFNFNENCKCRKNELELTNAFININYGSACCDAGGISEIVLREYIGDWYWLGKNIPCIYNGMPLRPEFRVFYDFDNHKVLYSANYWDWDYCHWQIEQNATDKIVYDSYYPEIRRFYYSHYRIVENIVNDYLNYVDDIPGKWSVDVMYDKQHNKYWLIDMATKETSAYGDRDNT